MRTRWTLHSRRLYTLIPLWFFSAHPLVTDYPGRHELVTFALFPIYVIIATIVARGERTPRVRLAIVVVYGASFIWWFFLLDDALDWIGFNTPAPPSSGFGFHFRVITTTVAVASSITAAMLFWLSRSRLVLAGTILAGLVATPLTYFDVMSDTTWHAIVAASLCLWALGHNRYPPGHCQRCGYDLTGLPSPQCPECGANAESAHPDAPSTIAQ